MLISQLPSLWFIRNNCVCQLPASYINTASYISKRPITPGLLYNVTPPQHFQLPNFAPTGPDIARWVTWVMLGEIFRSDFYFLIFTIHFQHFSFVKYAHDGENISINSDSIRRAKSDSFSNSTLENFQTWNKHERQPKLHENSSSEPQNSKQKPAENPISIMFHSENDKIFMFYHACAKSKNAYPSIMNHTFWTATW